MEEECGLKSDDMVENGLLTIEVIDQPIISEVYLFTSTKYMGTIVESNGSYIKYFEIKLYNIHLVCCKINDSCNKK